MGEGKEGHVGRMQALYMQILGPGLSLTSVPVTTERARKQRESDTGREMWRNREACSVVFQWSPVGKPLASVNNALAPSMWMLDANDDLYHCMYLTVSL